MPPHNFEPIWTVEQVVDLYKRMGPIIKEIDPEAVLIGPTLVRAGTNPDFWIQFFYVGRRPWHIKANNPKPDSQRDKRKD